MESDTELDISACCLGCYAHFPVAIFIAIFAFGSVPRVQAPLAAIFYLIAKANAIGGAKGA